MSFRATLLVDDIDTRWPFTDRPRFAFFGFGRNGP